MTPFASRRPFLTGLIGAAVGLAVVIGAAVIVERHRADDLADRAQRLERGWPAYAAAHLADFPSLVADDAAAFAEDDVFVSVHLELTGAGPELDASEALGLLEAACGYVDGQDGVDEWVDLRLRATTPDPESGDLDVWRAVKVDCAADRSALDAWLRWAERHPLPVTRGPLWIELMGDADSTGPLDVSLDLPRPVERVFRAGFKHLCAFQSTSDVSRTLTSEADGASYLASDVDCSDVESELAEWRSSAERH